ncbi:MAG TPA: NAD-dependent epimerase/dehydratase family protein [Jatrophihabitans sp.]|nr:NAD-dependent epimerase/dehydratase family protein [Jatrophihabitans sp.]
MPGEQLTVAVTGPTGTFGAGLMPKLQDEARIRRIVGIARRPFDPAEHGWTKMEYRRGDVRDEAALAEAFAGADVVVHLAFMITGAASRATIRAINVEGTLNTFRAAAAAGVSRFVYASSVAAYGFHRDNPVGLTEDWPTRPATRLFYAQEKAELEELLADEHAAARTPIGLYLLRPPIVVGPHAVGAKIAVPSVPSLARLFGNRTGLPRLPVPVPLPVPQLPLQLIHEDDVGQALLLAALGAGPAGAYNIAGDGVLTLAAVAREFGLLPIPVPAGISQAAAAAATRMHLPFLPPSVDWIEALTHPAIMDTTKAREQLGWRPRYSALEALRDTVRGASGQPAASGQPGASG